MDRKQFLKTCGFGCLAGASLLTLLQSCSTSQALNKDISGSDILVPITDFEFRNSEKTTYRKYIVIQNEILKNPICVYRFSETEYSALLMKCTHQGAGLEVFGDKLQCPAHGSEFSNKGVVENGPANADLRRFPVRIENNILKISLK